MRLNERRSGIDALLGVFDALVLGVVLLDAQGERLVRESERCGAARHDGGR